MSMESREYAFVFVFVFNKRGRKGGKERERERGELQPVQCLCVLYIRSGVSFDSTK